MNEVPWRNRGVGRDLGTEKIYASPRLHSRNATRQLGYTKAFARLSNPEIEEVILCLLTSVRRGSPGAGNGTSQLADGASRRPV